MATLPTARNHPTVVFYGDSIVTGWRGTTTPRARWSSLVSDALGWSEINLAINGMGYYRRRGPRGADGEREVSSDDATLLDAAIRLEPDMIVVCLGLNDVAFLPQATDVVHDAVDGLHARLANELPTTPVLVTTYFPSKELSPRASQIDSWVEDAAARWGHTYVEDFHMATAEVPDLLCDDGLHPNDDGHRTLAARIAPTCSRLMRCDPQYLGVRRSGHPTT